MSHPSQSSEYEFVIGLRAAVERYLAAVDRWEAAYQKYYRLPGYAAKISDDLKPEHLAYREQKRELEKLVPRARRLCLKYELRDVFSQLARTTLGEYAPQERMDSAIGRNERSLVTQCLVDLEGACQDFARAGQSPARESKSPADKPAGKGGLLRRLVNYFY
jgi:hypothetical protein